MPVCKYGQACNRKDCVFRHPAKSAVAKFEESSESVNDQEVCLPYLASVCAFGERCFYHHPSPSEAEKIRKQLESKWCRFGASCKTNGCLFKHPPQGSCSSSDSSPHSPITTPKRVPTVVATGPVYRASTAPAATPSFETVPIPKGVYLSYDDALATQAILIKDPIERFGLVNQQQSAAPEDCFVLDLHFQSCKTVLTVLDQVLPQCIEYLESPLGQSKNIWLVTGSGRHVPLNSHQVKGGVLLETVLSAVIARTADIKLEISVGTDALGNRGAVRIRKK